MSRELLREIRSVIRQDKLKPKSNAPKLIATIKDNYELIENMEVRCCYCGEMVALDHYWIIDKTRAKLSSIRTKDTGEVFWGWDNKFDTTPTQMRHPHVSGQNICLGIDNAFTGPNAASDALVMGLNPGSPYFNIKNWLAAVGHQCEAMGDYCPTHGYAEKFYPALDEGAWRRDAAYECTVRSMEWALDAGLYPCPYCKECKPAPFGTLLRCASDELSLTSYEHPKIDDWLQLTTHFMNLADLFGTNYYTVYSTAPIMFLKLLDINPNIRITKETGNISKELLRYALSVDYLNACKVSEEVQTSARKIIAIYTKRNNAQLSLPVLMEVNGAVRYSSINLNDFLCQPLDDVLRSLVNRTRDVDTRFLDDSTIKISFPSSYQLFQTYPFRTEYNELPIIHPDDLIEFREWRRYATN